MKGFLKNFVFAVLMLAATAGFFSLFLRESEEPKEVSLSQIVADINRENIKTIAVAGNSLEIVY